MGCAVYGGHKMRKIRLTDEEREIMQGIERDEFIPVKGKKLKEVTEAIATRSIQK